MSNWLDHSSIVGKIGSYGDKYLNPISWITGGKSTKLTSEVLPAKVNGGLSTVMKPFDKIDKAVNPVRKIPIVNRAGDIIANKPGDALAITAGAVFGAGALLGGGAGGGAGAGGSGAGLTTSSGFGGVGTDGAVSGLSGGAGSGVGEGLVAGGEGTAMGGSAGTLGAADSSAASSQLGLTAGDVSAGSGADVGGLASADSAAVDAEGAEPGLTQGYGPAQSAPASSQQQQGQQKRKKRPQLGPAPQVGGPSEEQYQQLVNQQSSAIAQSSKSVKTRGATDAAMQSGIRGTDMVSTNGVHVAAIQELNKQIESLGAQIAAVKAKRSSKGAQA